MKMKTLLNPTRDGRQIRFTNFVDETSLEFERNAKPIFPEGSLDQYCVYLAHCKREFYLLQITSSDGLPAMQACVYVGRARFLKGFAMASVPGLNLTRNVVEEAFGLKVLAELMESVPGVMTLRLQAKRFENETLSEFQSRSERLQYFQSAPLGPTRTLLIDLLDQADTLAASLPQKTRSKVRHASKSKVRISELNRNDFMEVCETAMNESRKRSGGGTTDFDFKAPFEIAKEHPDTAKVLGLFIEGKHNAPLAYVIGYCTGEVAEFASAGAFGDEALRSLPYNYFLLWELMNWARSKGAKVMDLGGVTEGGPNDPLAGIARFKRSFSTREIEIGREMVKIVRPLRFKFYCALKGILSGFRWKNPVEPQIDVQTKTMGMMPSYD